MQKALLNKIQLEDTLNPLYDYAGIVQSMMRELLKT